MQVGLVQHPPGQVHERREHRPDREPAHVAPDEADRPQQGEPDGDQTEQQRPQPAALEAEDLLRERRRRSRDHDQLEGRPAEVLRHVDGRWRIGAAATERRPQHNHPGNSRVGADQTGQSEQQVPRDRADHDRDQRVPQRERRHEHGAEHDHEQADREVSPEEHRVQEPEHLQALRDRFDSPARCLLVDQATLPPLA